MCTDAQGGFWPGKAGSAGAYRVPQPLQVWGLQHECVEHLLSLPPHVQQDWKAKGSLLGLPGR